MVVATIIVLSVAVFVLLCICFALYRGKQDGEEQISSITKTNQSLVAANKGLREQSDSLQALTNQLDQKIRSLGGKLELQRSTIDSLNSVVDGLTADKQQLTASCAELRASLDNAVARNEGDDDVLARKREELEQLNQALEIVKSRKAELEESLAATNEELQDALRQQTVVDALLLDDDLEGFDLLLDSDQRRIVQLIDEVIAQINVPDIARALRKYVGSKMYLPMLQSELKMRGGDKGLCGIYCLRLKNDPNVCYVGQAVNIKERWYTHAKKMLKAEDPGNEKLYRYGIEDFEGCVVEGNVPVKELNTREKYGIEGFRADSVGLNSKR